MRRLLVLTFTLWMIVAMAPIASAHVAYEEDYAYYTSTGKCLRDWSETSHGSTGYGYFKIQSTSLKAVVAPCEATNRVGAGYLANRWRIYRWNTTKSLWVLCEPGTFYYNQNSTDIFTTDWTWTAPPTSHCGNGWYGNFGGAFLSVNGKWHGGYVWSDPHCLPATSTCSGTPGAFTSGNVSGGITRPKPP